MLTFQELGGSPTEEYSLDGFTAKRVFLVDWQNRNEFVKAFSETSAQANGLKYPGRDDVYAYRLRIEPFDADTVDVQILDDLNLSVAHYNGSHAKITVDYRTAERHDRTDGPMSEAGTSITYRMVIEPEIQEIPVGTQWRWKDTLHLLKSEETLCKRIPQTLHILTWNNVVNPPWETISKAQGTVNNAVFIGCQPETLLFEGAEANKLYRSGSEAIGSSVSSFVWSIKYTFRERATKIGGETYGWNHRYNEENGRWSIPLRHAIDKLYETKNFEALFQSLPSEAAEP